MRISELINKLAEIRDTCGDIPVVVWNSKEECHDVSLFNITESNHLFYFGEHKNTTVLELT